MVMTVEPGFGGQAFMQDPAAKIVAARASVARRRRGPRRRRRQPRTAAIVGGARASTSSSSVPRSGSGHDMAPEIRLVKALADEGYRSSSTPASRHAARPLAERREVAAAAKRRGRDEAAASRDRARHRQRTRAARTSCSAATLSRSRSAPAARAAAGPRRRMAPLNPPGSRRAPAPASPRRGRRGASPAAARQRGPRCASRASGRRSERGCSSCSASGRRRGRGPALARRITELRIFRDEDGRTNRSLIDVGGEVLVVSQFTLFADTSRGRRPGFTGAARRISRTPLRTVLRGGRGAGPARRPGRFGAEMAVELVNDGPFTLWLDTAEPNENARRGPGVGVRSSADAARVTGRSCSACGGSGCRPGSLRLAGDVTTSG